MVRTYRVNVCEVLLRDRKQRGNKQTSAYDSPTSSGGQAKYVSFPRPPREAALSFLTLFFFVKIFFEK